MMDHALVVENKQLKYVATKIQTAPAIPKIPPGRNPSIKIKI